jgi:transposase
MKEFRAYEPGQGYLLPPSPKDWLPEGHLAHFIDQLVDQLDLGAIYASYEEERGQPPYHPRMMVKVWLYAFARGIRSSRRVEQALHEDVAFRMLSGNQQPDHWTLSEFRRRHLPALGDLFVQTVELAARAGLVKLGHLAIDGTKIKANASKHAAMSYGRMKQEEERLRQEIERYFRETEATDKEEEGRYGSRQAEELPQHLKTAERRLQAIQEAKRALEEEARQRAQAEQEERKREAEQQGKTYRPRKGPQEARPKARAQRNFTDPDSRIMKSSDKAFIQGYNAQAAVDTESQIIVGCELTNEAGDVSQMAPLVREVERVTGRRPREVLADAGYWSEKNVQFLTKRGIEALIPPDKVRHRMWREEEPPPPPPSPEASLREVMRYKLKLRENKERYRMREKTVEPTFGQIKEGRGLRQFLLRGMAKVRALWRLDCAVHNLLKLWRAGFTWERGWVSA